MHDVAVRTANFTECVLAPTGVRSRHPSATSAPPAGGSGLVGSEPRAFTDATSGPQASLEYD
jgi:hypothetical protein